MGWVIKKQMASNSAILNAEQKQSLTSYPSTGSISDIEYMINSNFLKSISCNLLDREVSLMARSNNLIDEFANMNMKEMQTTKDSLTGKESKSELRGKWSRFERDRRLLVRKSNNNILVSRQYEQILKQIKAKCSSKTYQTVQNLICQRNTLPSLQTNEDQWAIKVKAQEEEIQRLLEHNTRFTKEKQLPHEHEREFKKEMERIRGYVEEKEMRMKGKLEEIRCVQRQIEMAMLKEGQGGCQECRKMKKLKDTIKSYQRCLCEESKHMDCLFQKYKESVFAKSSFI